MSLFNSRGLSVLCKNQFVLRCHNYVNLIYDYYGVPRVIGLGDGSDSLYRGSVTHVCVVCHTQIVVTADIIVVKDVDRYFKRRL